MKQFYPHLENFPFKSKATFFFLFLILSITKLQAQLSGNYNVGTGQTYTTITAAIAALNTSGVSGPVTFSLIDASYTTAETFPIVITAYSNASATNTVTIRPAASNSGVVISSANSTATFDLNGVSFFSIDGRAGGTGSTSILSIVNTSASGVAIRITNDASFNLINYCDVRGQNTVSVPSITTLAGVIFINSANATTLGGNDKNTISNCNVHGTGTTTSTFPTIGICAYGTQTTTGSYNDTCTINNCNIYDIYNPTLAATHIKIDLGNTAWNITNNHFYQTNSIDYLTSTAVYRALWVTPNVSNLSNAANGFNITGNFVGGNNAAGTGTLTLTGSSTFSFWVMDISVGLGTATSIQNNTITNISMTTANTGSAAMEGINIANGNANVGTITGNIIGSVTSTPGITFTASANTGGPIGIRTGGGTNNTINIANNVISGFVLNSSTTVSAIFNGIAASGGTTVNITNNIIGSATIPNSINAPAASTSTSIQSIRGIIANGTGTSGSISGNLIANMNTNYMATGSQGSSVVGIIIASTAGAYSITGNTIRNLTSSGQTSSAGATSPVIGIAYTSTTTSAVISANTIHTLALTHAPTLYTTTLIGIYYAGPSGTANLIEKNFIHSLSVPDNDSALVFIKGIDLASGGTQCRNNMIRMGLNASGASVTKTCIMMGVNEDGGIHHIYYNTIYIGGNASQSFLNSYALNSTLSSVSREIKNNIFSNLRTNSFGVSSHYAVHLAGINNQTINANNYWTGNSFLARIGTTAHTSLGLWKVATSQDSLSVSVNSNFKNPNGSNTNIDLHIDTAGTAISFLESSGIAVTGISNDYDNDTRPGPTGSTKGGGTRPDIGADEFDGVPRPQCSNSTAGNAVSNLDTICANGSVTLNLTGSTGTGIGNLYQWQSSTDAVNYNNISGATQSQFIASGLTITTYYRCILSCIFGATSSTSSAKKVTVINPQITGTTPAQICGPGSLTLGATTSLGRINWYASATGGTVLDTGITFITPVITTTTTYYIDAVYNGCYSAFRTPIIATIKTIPTLTSSNSNSRCGAGSVVLSATTSAGIIDWYAASTGGVSLGTGINFNTPSISATTIYYAEVTANGCVSASRTPVTATIIPQPTITSVTPAGSCGSGSVVLNATTNAGIISWFSASTGGIALDTGLTFTTPVIFAPTTYYVEVKLNNCTSATRTPVLASIYSNPNITGTVSVTGCAGEKVVLSATASTGIINWYTASTGGTSIATGNSFTTPVLTTTTTYYVDATANGCTSSFRTPAKATINPSPTITSVISASICGSGSLTLGATASSGIVYWYSDSIGGTLLTTGNSFNTPTLTNSTFYYVETRDNGCTSSPRIAVLAKIKKIPTITGTTPASSCKPASLTLSATVSAGNLNWYSVPFGGSILNTGLSYSTGLLNSTTTYYLEATDSGCISASRIGIDATIYPALNKATTVNGFTITAAATGVTYQWVDCNAGYQLISGATSQSYTATANGNYAVIIKNTNCTDTSACVAITKIGLNASENLQKIQVFPNPTNDYINLTTETNFIGEQFQISDMQGRIISSGIISSSLQKISLVGLAPGVYILNCGKEANYAIKILKR